MIHTGVACVAIGLNVASNNLEHGANSCEYKGVKGMVAATRECWQTLGTPNLEAEPRICYFFAFEGRSPLGVELCLSGTGQSNMAV
jgi:hypothetical protein